MLLFDTLSRKKREFRPIAGKGIGIYTCGPSVYSYSHIGNFRTYVFEDVLVRYLRYKGWQVKRVMNVTDVEDKAIEAAMREGVSIGELSKDKCRTFFRDWRKLGMGMPDVVAPVSGHIPAMVSLIARICGKGLCRREHDGIYFDVRKSRGYGRLRRLRSPAYLGVSRHDDYSREGLWDFRLWKFHSRADGGAAWDSPFGKGRPGWHIECSAIAMKYLGESFDIHCGGTDNIFPHHENEIAQSEGATGKPLARFWMHAKHLTVGKMKMSKRTGNVLYVTDLEKKGVMPRRLRHYLISERYRSRLDFTIGRFRERECDCSRTTGLLRRLRRVRRSGGGVAGRSLARRVIQGFESAMDDDLNTRLALKRIRRQTMEAERLLASGKMGRTEARLVLDAFERVDSVLNVF